MNVTRAAWKVLDPYSGDTMEECICDHESCFCECFVCGRKICPRCSRYCDEWLGDEEGDIVYTDICVECGEVVCTNGSYDCGWEDGGREFCCAMSYGESDVDLPLRDPWYTIGGDPWYPNGSREKVGR